MKLEIPRLDITRSSSDEFFRRYFEPEQPVILHGFEGAISDLLVEKLWSLAELGGPAGQNGYFAAPIGLGDGQVPVPEIIEQIFVRDDIAHKPEPLRLWMQPQGHVTGLHYDGNSLCGMNWHIAGKKHWLLVAPTKLLPMMPLTYLTMTADDFEPSARKYDVMDFTVEKGEMLFIPRYWAHRVSALGETNANLNWVWTRKAPNRISPVGRRESATLKVRGHIGPLDNFVVPRVSLKDYGDGGPEMFTRYTEQVSSAEVLRFVLREALNCLVLPFRASAVRRRQKKSDESNFHDSLKT
ncbi:MAG: hypothetical protein ACI92E_002764 [Oceanicoccus sp.]